MVDGNILVNCKVILWWVGFFIGKSLSFDYEIMLILDNIYVKICIWCYIFILL